MFQMRILKVRATSALTITSFRARRIAEENVLHPKCWPIRVLMPQYSLSPIDLFGQDWGLIFGDRQKLMCQVIKIKVLDETAHLLDLFHLPMSSLNMCIRNYWTTPFICERNILIDMCYSIISLHLPQEMQVLFQGGYLVLGFLQ